MNNTLKLDRTPKAPKEFYAVDHVINDAVACRMYKALMVMVTDPKINSFLKLNDFKALSQAHDAIEQYKYSFQESNIDNHNNL